MHSLAQYNYTSLKLQISPYYLKTDVINQNIHNLVLAMPSAAWTMRSFVTRDHKIVRSDCWLRYVHLFDCLSVRMNNPAPSERIFIKCHIWVFLWNLRRKFKIN